MTAQHISRTICIVDCNDDGVASVQQMLADLNAGFNVFGDAESFLLHVHGGHPLPACLIAEVLLPGISGLELFKTLQKSGAHVPTVLVTSENSVSMAVRAIRSGVLDYFEKPLIESRLRYVVATILDSCGSGVPPR